MQYERLSRASTACCLGIFLLAAIAASATSGREFSGYFDISGVQEEGDMVQVTLHLKLFNHSSSDARSVIVALVDSSPAMTVRGNFQPVRVWKSQQFIEMSQQFTVTKREFNEWMRPPAQPNLVILFQDGKGATWQKTAQMSRRPLVPAAAE